VPFSLNHEAECPVRFFKAVNLPRLAGLMCIGDLPFLYDGKTKLLSALVAGS